MGATGGVFPRIHVLVVRQLPAVLQRQVDTVFGVSEEPVLGQKAGEEHPVPVLVRGFVGEVAELLGAGLAVTAVPGLPSARAEAVTEGLGPDGHRFEGLGTVHGE